MEQKQIQNQLEATRRERDEARTELSEALDKIEALLEPANRMTFTCLSGETRCYDNDFDLKDGEMYSALIQESQEFLRKHSRLPKEGS